MTVIAQAHVELADGTTVTISPSAEPTHISCCLSEPGEAAPMLCGKVEDVSDEWIDDEPPENICVVCHDLNENDVCPIIGHCPYGADWVDP